MSYNWKWFRAGRMSQVSLTCGADIAALAELDRKQWIAISMPTTGVRFDARMLELMDTDHDGRIRTPEVLAAIDFLKAKKVDFDSLFTAGSRPTSPRSLPPTPTRRRSQTGRRRARHPKSPLRAMPRPTRTRRSRP